MNTEHLLLPLLKMTECKLFTFRHTQTLPYHAKAFKADYRKLYSVYLIGGVKL